MIRCLIDDLDQHLQYLPIRAELLHQQPSPFVAGSIRSSTKYDVAMWNCCFNRQELRSVFLTATDYTVYLPVPISSHYGHQQLQRAAKQDDVR